MDSWTYTQFKTSRGFAYSYIHLPPTQGRGYILFLHGFPSSAHDWRHQILYFHRKGFGIVAPDLLGYGSTSKPLDLGSYTGKGMSQDVREILEHEAIDTAIGVGHDWGSFLLSRLANYYPSLFSKLVFVDVGYSAPGLGLTEQTVTNINTAIQSAMGYSVFGYFLFFREEDAAQLLDHHHDSAQSLFHSRDKNIGKRYMGAVGGFRIWLSEGKIAENAAYLSPEEVEYTRNIFSPSNGGYGPSINWYKAALADINGDDENAIPEGNRVLNQPVLLLNGKNFITGTADFPNQMKAFATRLNVKNMDAGHWIMLERAQETNAALEEFFESQA